MEYPKRRYGEPPNTKLYLLMAIPPLLGLLILGLIIFIGNYLCR